MRTVSRPGRRGSDAGRASGGAGCPVAARTSAVATGSGTEVAWAKISRSCTRFSAAYSFVASVASTWWALATRTAPRTTTSAHRASASTSAIGRIAWYASIARIAAGRSMPSWCRSDETVIASSPTVQVRFRSPRSITPSGTRVTGSPVTTLSSVRSPWMNWTGSRSATAVTASHAVRAAPASWSRSSSSGTYGRSSARTPGASRRSHWCTRSAAGATSSASATSTDAASAPIARTAAGER